MRLEDIGFYTLSDDRAKQASASSPLWRCELLVTGRCNFNCPYCRRVGPDRDMEWADARAVLDYWISEGLRNVRFSGGEPTLWPHLAAAAKHCRDAGVGRIAVSTNGSADMGAYGDLLDAGVNDFSISLDACCAEDGRKMTGAANGFDKTIATIGALAPRAYVTVGVVVTADNEDHVFEIVGLARSLGVADVRVIPAAQCGRTLSALPKTEMPILEYRRRGDSVRGLWREDARRCPLALDDMAAVGKSHYPCIIYAREGGAAIGEIGASCRRDREAWAMAHNAHLDPICLKNCLDVCRDYNNAWERFHE